MRILQVSCALDLELNNNAVPHTSDFLPVLKLSDTLCGQLGIGAGAR